jgi:uncharacterized protein YukE
MTQVIVNPEEMRRFARNLNEIADAMQSRKVTTNSQFERLKESWKDPKYAQFEETYLRTLVQIDRFTRAAKIYASFLHRKAAKADVYLKGR